MKREAFLEEIKEAIQADELNESDFLLDMDEWDSLAETAVLLAFSSNLNLFLEVSKIRECNTVKELLDLGNAEYE
ncbi:MAG: hypothetical protein EOM53_00420 [Alphaproteobacteria bacterium]|nr:hypothetical protein [Alphaproteobacteria bacterium]NCB49135.1 hypothetical protein [Alphaproteobacteria bacterium]